MQGWEYCFVVMKDQLMFTIPNDGDEKEPAYLTEASRTISAFGGFQLETLTFTGTDDKSLDKFVQVLEKLGLDGWELVNATDTQTAPVPTLLLQEKRLYFKRPIP